jgi:catechol-2,3-dioxygenase
MKPQPMICAIHHAAVQVANLDEAFARWSHLLGLHGEKLSASQAVLRCAHEDYSLVLRETREKPFYDYACYQLAAGLALRDARKMLHDRGEKPEDFQVPLHGPALKLADPEGNAVVLIERVQPADRRPSEVQYSGRIPGWHPRKLGHVNFLTADIKRQVEWYTRVLEFSVTDWIAEEGVWLHVNHDHHSLAFVNKGLAHIHHMAFELVDWGEMRVGLDHLAQNKRHIVWGPGRHGMARNLFSYFRMPEEEMFVELFSDLEELAADHQVRHFPDDPHSSNTWGALPPRTYFRFDKQAIEAELTQSYAYAQSVSVVP